MRSGRLHEVELFEAQSGQVGTRHTVTHDSLELDTGFIVHNEANYPQLTRLFRELGVETQSSEMSFAVSCGCGLEWSSKRPWRAGPRLLREILRFLRTAGAADTDGKSFDRFLATRVTRSRFAWHYLVPMTSALWSTAPERRSTSRPRTGSSSSTNHSMLGLRRSRWRTVTGGSRTYVRALLDRLGAPVHLGHARRLAAPHGGGVELRAADGAARSFDAAVVATSAPTGLALLDDASDAEREILSALRVHRQRDRPAHRRAPPPAAHVESLLVELPVARLRRRTPTGRRSRTRSTGCSGSTRRASTASRSTGPPRSLARP